MRHPILLVEPDQQTRVVHRMVLQRAGYAVVEACTGEEAVWKVHQAHPSVIVMECSAPGVSGLRAAEVLKSDPKLRHIPILLLGSSPDADEERQARSAGCNAYLAEPCTPSVVLEAVRELTSAEHDQEEPRSGPDRLYQESDRIGEPAWTRERMSEVRGGLQPMSVGGAVSDPTEPIEEALARRLQPRGVNRGYQ
jgi:CheY-like chemotaxis protein